jgi:hypothetical protein
MKLIVPSLDLFVTEFDSYTPEVKAMYIRLRVMGHFHHDVVTAMLSEAPYRAVSYIENFPHRTYRLKKSTVARHRS